MKEKLVKLGQKIISPLKQLDLWFKLWDGSTSCRKRMVSLDEIMFVN